MSNPLARSLTLRLLAIFCVIAIVVLLLLGLLFSQGLSGQWKRNIQPHLLQYVTYVHQDLGSPPSPARANDIAAAVPVDIALFQDKQLVHSTGEQYTNINTLRFSPLDGRLARRLARQAGDQAISLYIGRRGPSRLVRVDQENWTVIYTLDPRRRRFGDRDELLIALFTVAMTLLGGWWIIKQQLRPINSIKNTVARISNGELDARTGVTGSDDLATLGNSIDGMAARLQQMLDTKRELLLSVSHELRSPLTRARVAIELLPASSARDRVGHNLVEMGELIDGLLESERLREAHTALVKHPVDFADVVNKTARAVALANNASVSLNLPEDPVIVNGDAARLQVLVRTLVDNAFTHGTPGHKQEQAGDQTDSSVHLELSVAGGAVILDVEDDGPGIAREHLERVTEPFERLDPSRSRNTGGVGLGLNLARLVAEAHGGTLQLENSHSGGLRARVTVPLQT